MAQCLVQLGIISYYELNKNYIAKNLCENRDKPAMKCCGKCYLRKQLKKVTQNDNNTKAPNNKVEKTEIVAFVIPNKVILPESNAFNIDVVQHPSMQHLHGFNIPFPIFHPPSFEA
jgi:hypothetical protein